MSIIDNGSKISGFVLCTKTSKQPVERQLTSFLFDHKTIIMVPTEVLRATDYQYIFVSRAVILDWYWVNEEKVYCLSTEGLQIYTFHDVTKNRLFKYELSLARQRLK